MANRLVWVDIPVVDLDRAITFYSSVLSMPVKKEIVPGMSIAVLCHEEEEATGCLLKKEGEQPTASGPLIYLSVQGRLDQAIAAVIPNGGKILRPKHQIGPYGFSAVILDSEGNRIALHSM